MKFTIMFIIRRLHHYSHLQTLIGNNHNFWIIYVNHYDNLAWKLLTAEGLIWTGKWVDWGWSVESFLDIFIIHLPFNDEFSSLWNISFFSWFDRNLTLPNRSWITCKIQQNFNYNNSLSLSVITSHDYFVWSNKGCQIGFYLNDHLQWTNRRRRRTSYLLINESEMSYR